MSLRHYKHFLFYGTQSYDLDNVLPLMFIHALSVFQRLNWTYKIYIKGSFTWYSEYLGLHRIRRPLTCRYNREYYCWVCSNAVNAYRNNTASMDIRNTTTRIAWPFGDVRCVTGHDVLFTVSCSNSCVPTPRLYSVCFLSVSIGTCL